MSDPENEFMPIPPCPYPVHNPDLPAINCGTHMGWILLECSACKLQYDTREVEEYTHPHAIHIAQFVCPQGHLAESKREFTREPAAEDV